VNGYGLRVIKLKDVQLSLKRLFDFSETELFMVHITL